MHPFTIFPLSKRFYCAVMLGALDCQSKLFFSSAVRFFLLPTGGVVPSTIKGMFAAAWNLEMDQQEKECVQPCI